jgi:hypothetical protein
MMAELRVKRINGEHAIPKMAKPDPLEHQYLDENDDPIDMSVGTWVGQARAEALYGTAPPAGLGTAGVNVNTTTATATYPWHADDFSTPGVFRLILWVGNGTVRYGSTVYEWEVADAPGADPTV